jgi:hypothetical protein
VSCDAPRFIRARQSLDIQYNQRGCVTYLDILVQVMNEYDEQSDIAEDLRIKVSDHDPSKCWSSPLL